MWLWLQRGGDFELAGGVELASWEAGSSKPWFLQGFNEI